MAKSKDANGAFGRMRAIAAGSAGGISALARAAWLAKLGREDLAAKIVSEWKSDDNRSGGEPKNESPQDQMIRRLRTDENDARLTRSVHFWRDFARSRTMLSVREAALVAAMSILKVRVFEPRSTGDNFTSRGERTSKEVARQLRNYWEEYGKLSIEERMMTVLTNPKSNQKATREAARNIANLNQQRTLGTTVFSDFVTRGKEKPRPNPLFKKFMDPTVAEAIFGAMDRDLAQHDRQNDDRLWDYRRRGIESIYIDAVTQLGDDHIVPEIRKRCDRATTTRMRRKYSFAAHALGDSQLLIAFANDFAAGKITLPKDDRSNTNWDDQPGTVELAGIVGAFVRAKLPASEKALLALTNKQHAAYRVAARAVRDLSPQRSDHQVWFSHRYCVTILRRELDDTTPTDFVVLIDDQGRYVKQQENSSTISEVPQIIANAESRTNRATLRRCDVAAEKLSELVVGLPEYHPLHRKAQQKLTAIKSSLDKHADTLRVPTTEESEIHNRWGSPSFMLK